MRSKTYVSKINLQAETTNSGEQEEQREKTDMLSSIGKQSGESVESGNPWPPATPLALTTPLD